MITLTSDFGSPYPAAMRGVILQRGDARLVDVAHDLPRQDVRAAAFWIREVLPYFPAATHLVVVDPGVGTDRAAVVVRAGEHWLIGPDNGVLVPVARRLGDDGEFDVYEWRYEDCEAPRASDTRAAEPRAISSTFHGRDVFAPAAAEVHESDDPRALDAVQPVETYEDLAFPDPDVHEEGAIGEVLVVDGFGNVVTNVPGTVLDGLDEVRVNGQPVPADRAYATVDVGQWLATVGSHGNVELAVNQGRGDDAFGLAPGDDVAVEW